MPAAQWQKAETISARVYKILESMLSSKAKELEDIKKTIQSQTQSLEKTNVRFQKSERDIESLERLSKKAVTGFSLSLIAVAAVAALAFALGLLAPAVLPIALLTASALVGLTALGVTLYTSYKKPLAQKAVKAENEATAPTNAAPATTAPVQTAAVELTTVKVESKPAAVTFRQRIANSATEAANSISTAKKSVTEKFERATRKTS